MNEKYEYEEKIKFLQKTQINTYDVILKNTKHIGDIIFIITKLIKVVNKKL